MCAHLDRLDDDEMRELVTDAWRMCTPQMLHDLPELPAPAMRVWDLVERQDWHGVRPLLHPYLRFEDGDVSLRGRNQVLDHLARSPDAAAADRGRGPRRAGLPLAAVIGERFPWPTGWIRNVGRVAQASLASRLTPPTHHRSSAGPRARSVSPEEPQDVIRTVTNSAHFV